MSRKGKSIAAIVLLFAAGIVTAACTMQKPEENPSGKKSTSSFEDWYWDSVQRNSVSDFGMYEHETDLYFTDSKKGKAKVICNRAECSHDSADCPAYFEGYVDGVAYQNGKMNYFSNEGSEKENEAVFYEADGDGANRKKLESFEKVTEPSCIRYYKNRVLFSYFYRQPDGNESGTEQAGIYMYDRKKKKKTLLYSGTGNNELIQQVCLYRGDVYYAEKFYDVSKKEQLKHADDDAFEQQHWKERICRVPADGGKAEEVIKDAHVESLLSVDGGFLYKNNEDGKLWVYDLEKKTSEKILDETRIQRFSMTGKQEAFFDVYDEKTKQCVSYRYRKGKTEKLGTGNKSALAVFTHTVYLLGEDGNIYMMDTKDYLKGDFSKTRKCEFPKLE